MPEVRPVQETAAAKYPNPYVLLSGVTAPNLVTDDVPFFPLTGKASSIVNVAASGVTGEGAVLFAEVSMDPARQTWFPIFGKAQADQSSQSSIQADGAFVYDASGWIFFRVRLVSIATPAGGVTVTATTSPAGTVGIAGAGSGSSSSSSPTVAVVSLPQVTITGGLSIAGFPTVAGVSQVAITTLPLVTVTGALSLVGMPTVAGVSAVAITTLPQVTVTGALSLVGLPTVPGVSIVGVTTLPPVTVAGGALTVQGGFLPVGIYQNAQQGPAIVGPVPLATNNNALATRQTGNLTLGGGALNSLAGGVISLAGGGTGDLSVPGGLLGVTLSNPVTVSGALSIAGMPTVPGVSLVGITTLPAPVTVTGALSIAAFAPTIAILSMPAINGAAASQVGITTLPQVTVTGALSIAAFAPTVAVLSMPAINVATAPTVAVLSIPGVTVTGVISVAGGPTVPGVSLVGITTLPPVTVTGALSIAAFAPTVAVLSMPAINVTAAPTVAVLSIPGVTVTGVISIAGGPTVPGVSLVGITTLPAPVTVTGALSVAGFAPTIAVLSMPAISGSAASQVGITTLPQVTVTGALSIAAFAPTIAILSMPAISGSTASQVAITTLPQVTVTGAISLALGSSITVIAGAGTVAGAQSFSVAGAPGVAVAAVGTFQDPFYSCNALVVPAGLSFAPTVPNGDLNGFGSLNILFEATQTGQLVIQFLESGGTAIIAQITINTTAGQVLPLSYPPIGRYYSLNWTNTGGSNATLNIETKRSTNPPTPYPWNYNPPGLAQAANGFLTNTALTVIGSMSITGGGVASLVGITTLPAPVTVTGALSIAGFSPTVAVLSLPQVTVTGVVSIPGIQTVTVTNMYTVSVPGSNQQAQVVVPFAPDQWSIAGSYKAFTGTFLVQTVVGANAQPLTVFHNPTNSGVNAYVKQIDYDFDWSSGGTGILPVVYVSRLTNTALPSAFAGFTLAGSFKQRSSNASPVALIFTPRNGGFLGSSNVLTTIAGASPVGVIDGMLFATASNINLPQGSFTRSGGFDAIDDLIIAPGEAVGIFLTAGLQIGQAINFFAAFRFRWREGKDDGGFAQ